MHTVLNIFLVVNSCTVGYLRCTTNTNVLMLALPNHLFTY